MNKMTYKDITDLVVKTGASFWAKTDLENHQGTRFLQLANPMLQMFPIDFCWHGSGREVRSATQANKISQRLHPKSVCWKT